jgi:predicted transcriptional regulator
MSPSYALVKGLFEVLEGMEEERRGGGLEGFRVGDVHASPVETVDVGDSMRGVWARMFETSFSQFPVVDGESFVGSITEKGVTRVLREYGEGTGDLEVGKVMGPPFPSVDVGVPLSSVVSLLNYCQAVLTVGENGVLGIVTHSDVGKIFLGKTCDE